MEKLVFVEYPKCTTCQKAKRFLEESGIPFADRHIVENPPTADELREWIKRSELPVKKFFNTSGLRYKALALKEKLPTMSDEEQIALLATDGMLVKRPILVTPNTVLVGFKADAWSTVGNAK